MLEILRQRRNANELSKLHPFVRGRYVELLSRLEKAGWRPRLQDTARSIAQQEKYYAQGLSRIRISGPHTNTLNGKSASLASHFLDDDRPLSANNLYFAKLAIEARKCGLHSGILFGLSDTSAERDHRAKMEQALAGGMLKVLEILIGKDRGFDPLHVEPPEWKSLMDTDEKGQKI